MTTNIRELSKHDLVFLLESVEESLDCKEISQFEGLVEKVKSYLNFDHAFCTALNKKELVPLNVLDLSYPKEYLSRYFDNQYFLDDHVSTELLSTFELQHWKEVDRKYNSFENRDPATIEAYEFGLQDGITYGTIDADSKIGTCFSFAGKSIEYNYRSSTIITYLTPHLAEILRKVLYREIDSKESLLSPREKEVLTWTKEGKSSWEVGLILGIQERTVNFHLTNIKSKLNATTKTQALAIAIAKGEISI